MKIQTTLASFFLGFTVFCQVPTAGLVSFYPFSSNANDQSGNSFDGTVNGATLTSDRNLNANAAYNFNGNSDYIDIPYAAALKPSFPFTISLWFEIDAFGTTSSVLYASDEGNNSYSGFWIGYLPSGSISAGYGNGQGLGGSNRITKSSSTTLGIGTWHNVVAVFNGLNDIDLYLDCVLDPGSYSGSANSMFLGSNNSVIGRSLGHSPTSYHNGKIDGIRLYDQAIDASGISALCTENPSLSINELDNDVVNIYPNPAEDYLNVELENSNVQSTKIEIRNTLGKLVHAESSSFSSFKVSTLEWGQSGFYLLDIFDLNGNLLYQKKIILE